VVVFAEAYQTMKLKRFIQSLHISTTDILFDITHTPILVSLPRIEKFVLAHSMIANPSADDVLCHKRTLPHEWYVDLTSIGINSSVELICILTWCLQQLSVFEEVRNLMQHECHKQET
jgi:hypothetical protein